MTVKGDGAPSAPRSKPIPLRTALIGLAFSTIVSLWGQYASAQLNYNYLTFPHQSPITNHQSPITNHQSPITNHQ